MRRHLVLLCAALLPAGCSDGGQAPAPAPAPDALTAAVAVSPLAAAAAESAEVKVTTCNIETVAGIPLKGAISPLPAGNKVRFTGWAIDTLDHGVPMAAALRLVPAGGAAVRDVPIVIWRVRPDVAGAFGGDAAYPDSGFLVDVPTEAMAPAITT